MFDVSADDIHVTAYDDTNRMIDEFIVRGGVAGSETFLSTRGATSYAADNTGPAPLIPFTEGTYPPIASFGKVGNGALVTAGLAWNCINGQWKLGQYDVLFDIMFQEMVEGATAVLWYEGYGVAHDAVACSELVSALEVLGYTVTGDATMPITPDLLASYDIVVIPQLRLGSSYVGGDPNLLPWEDVEALSDFVRGGNGLMVMDAHDYGGNNWAHVQNKILEGIGADVALQSDGVYDWVDNWLGRGWHPMGTVDPDTEIGAEYVVRTGSAEIELWEISTVAPVPAFFIEKVPADGYSTLSGPDIGAALIVVNISTDIPPMDVHWPITVEVYYTQDAFDASGMSSEANLALFYWDTEQGMWRACPESGVNTERNCVTAAAYHLTRFAIMEK